MLEDVACYSRLRQGKHYLLHVMIQDPSTSGRISSCEIGPVPEMELEDSVKGDRSEVRVGPKIVGMVQRLRKEGLISEELFANGKPHVEILRNTQERGRFNYHGNS